MNTILSIIKNAFATIGEILKLLWQFLKFIFQKCWKFILLIGSIILMIFGISKISKEK